MASSARRPMTRSKTDLTNEEAIFLVELMAPCHKFLLGKNGSTLDLKGVETKVTNLSKSKVISAISQSLCAKFPRLTKDFDIEKWWRTTFKTVSERLETAEAFSEVDIAILRALYPEHPRVLALAPPNPQTMRSSRHNSSASSSSSAPSTSTGSPEPDLRGSPIPNVLNDALINIIREPTPPQKERRRSCKRKRDVEETSKPKEKANIQVQLSAEYMDYALSAMRLDAYLVQKRSRIMFNDDLSMTVRDLQPGEHSYNTFPCFLKK